MYEVIVGNVGRIYSGDAQNTARSLFDTYVNISKSGIGRAGHEEVTLFNNGMVVSEYVPDIQSER